LKDDSTHLVLLAFGIREREFDRKPHAILIKAAGEVGSVADTRRAFKDRYQDPPGTKACVYRPHRGSTAEILLR
jgi:hypothetical protein